MIAFTMFTRAVLYVDDTIKYQLLQQKTVFFLQGNWLTLIENRSHTSLYETC